MVVIANPDDQSQIDTTIQIFAEAGVLIQEMLKTKFSLFVVSNEQLEAKLPKYHKLFRIHYEDEVNAFVLFSRFNKNISVVHRIRQIELMDDYTFTNKLQEYSNLFEFSKEEDPEYRMVENL